MLMIFALLVAEALCPEALREVPWWGQFAELTIAVLA